MRNLRTITTTTLISAASLVALGLPAAYAAAPAPAAAATAGTTTASSARAAAPATVTASAADPVVRMATYNICKKACGKGKFSWAHRRLALVRTVDSVRPDVLAIQEANTQTWNGIRHIDDVVNLLGSIGYRIASTNYDSCTAGCTRGAHIFYNPARMHIAALPNPAVAVGMTGLSVIAETSFGPVQDRAVSWAFLSRNDSDRVAMYISVHLPTEKSAFSETLRVAIASKLRGWADRIVQASGVAADIVVAGDFNSYARRQPYGAQAVLPSSGALIDGYNAPVKANANYGTVNMAPKIKKYKGFPPRPYYYARTDPARIDYVFATVAPLRWEVVLRLTANGKFDNAYRASDHNMVLVDLPLA